ncbi:YfhO family protein [Limosilactobacillus gastricus]|uniref:Glycosyltransferase n=1 Tax=Limosilactobacillus gastricus DSM 16045 TaxID=1423749 RepID=A0A0R1VHG4_9LACO|nr:YfhO family protein [Limosilactobacillus gastricus]KRM02518.1 Glycosyltransferase [Limosilactobacillus gastricus DSM 16045]QGF40237.1 YfhO family protein [Limosilactobacillus gastricus]
MKFSFAPRTDKRQLYLGYTILFVFIAACLYCPYLIAGKTLIWDTDAFNQHLPLLAQYRQLVWHWLLHPFSSPNFWSFSWGLGTDTFQVFSYYTIGDVFAYIALLFPAAKITLAYQLTIVLRMYCVGLAFVYFAQHLPFRKLVIWGGAATYLVNSYLLYANVAQPFFTTTFIIFPLIIIQIERVLQGRSAWPLTLVFIWMLINNYYLAFILGVGAIIYLFLRVITFYRHQLDYGRTLWKLAFATVTSLLVSAVMLIPEIIAVRSSTRIGSAFANGLTTYPQYYYVLLAKQLINGDDWDFMYWSALGMASVIVVALVYVYRHAKRYPLITISLGASLLMMLIPAVGALFNGGMSPSNRWTLLIYLPLATSIMILLEHLTKIDRATLKWMIGISLVYLVAVVATYMFKNDDDLFVPVIFLLLSLLIAGAAYYQAVAHPLNWMIGLILLNVGFNAIYAALPFNGSFANQMLTKGEYQQIAKQRYGGLDKSLSRSLTYRISTISNNQTTGQEKTYNDLTSGLASISSYFSLQNQYLGLFSQRLGNSQYETNIPLQQVDDRTVLNNFLGVKYIFAQTTTDDDTKVPSGYFVDQTTEPTINYDQGQSSDATKTSDLKTTQTVRYTTKNAFPLLYWQNTYISPATYRHLSATAKERALASGVVVNSSAAKKWTTGMKKANLSGNVQVIATQLWNNRLQKMNGQSVTVTDPDAKYYLRLQKQTSAQQNELHLDIKSIHYQPFSMKKTLQLMADHLRETTLEPGAMINQVFTNYQNWRSLFLKGYPDMSYLLTASNKYGDETLEQPAQSKTSFFKVVTSGVLNLGAYGKHLPSQVTLTTNKLGKYRISYQLVAEQLGTKYRQEVRQIQAHGLKNLKISQNQISGNLTTSQVGILTSSIPYSSGWTATDNGKTVRLVRTNNAFIGLRLRTGHHHIVLRYHVPGLKVGIYVSLIGLLWLIISAIFTLIWRRKTIN